MDVIAVAIAGFIGAILRYVIGLCIPVESGFPYATIIVNLVGCLVLSYFYMIADHKQVWHPRYRLAIGTGLIGSFTTFSTFSVEALQLFQNGQFVMVTCYILIMILGSVGLAFVGVKLASLQKAVK